MNASPRYRKPRISTASLADMDRTKTTRLPSRDRSNAGMVPLVKVLSPVGRPPSSGSRVKSPPCG
jgi:hypothetical protein